MKQTQLNNSPNISKPNNHLFIQPKLSVNQPNDVYEQEADAVAEKVIQSKTIQQSETFFKPISISSIQRKCAHCEEEEKLQRKEENQNPTETNSEFEYYVDGLNNGGTSLPPDSKSFFESRIGYDFSNVKIHTDSVAAKSAQSINALAYTSGNNIVFNQNQFQPGTANGDKLIAHELTHVVQQAAGIHRKVMKMKEIENDLTYGIVDWEIKEKEVHRVLVLLEEMLKKTPADFNDTVQEMDRKGYVQRIYDNISEDDIYEKSDLLQALQNNKVRKVNNKEVIDSCRPEYRDKIASEITEIGKWADAGNKITTEFATRAIDSKQGSAAASLLDKYFFHQSTFRSLSNAEKDSLNNTITDAYKNVKTFTKNPNKIICASPFDSLCRAMAAAYVSGGTDMYFCQSFFRNEKPLSTLILFHELFHAKADKGDTGYAGERIFSYLPPLEAVNNADGYAHMAYESLLGATEANKTLNQNNDEYKNFTDDQAKELKQWVAYAARLFNNALNVIGNSSYDSQNVGNAAADNFKSTKSGELKDVIDTFKKAQTKTYGNIDFKYVDEDRSQGYKASNSKINIYRDFFRMKSDDMKIKTIFNALMEYGSSVRLTADLNDAEFSKQSYKQAIKNAASYTGYAWKVSAAFDKFQFAVGYIRYTHDQQFRMNLMIDNFRNSMNDIEFITTVQPALSFLKTEHTKDLEGIEPSNKSESDAIWQKHDKRFKALTDSIRKLYNWYFPFTIDLMVDGMMQTPDIKDELTGLTDSWIPRTFRSRIGTILNDRMTEIKADQLQQPDPWPAFDDLKNYADTIVKQLPGFHPALKQLQAAGKFIEDVSLQAFAKVKKTNDMLWFDYELDQLNDDYSDEIRTIRVNLQFEVISGDAFNPASSAINKIDAIKKDYAGKVKKLIAKSRDQTALASAIQLYAASHKLDPAIFHSAVLEKNGRRINVLINGTAQYQIYMMAYFQLIKINKIEENVAKPEVCSYQILDNGTQMIAGKESCKPEDFF